MKNILGTTEELRLTDENGVLRYEYNEDYQYTYNSNGNELTYNGLDGFWEKSTYDSNRNLLTYKNSNGYWYKRTYDSNGNELTVENSSGYKRGFDTPEYTMEELTKKLGYNFKII
jgi:uncharacterized protein RhaS with RHS repeats